MPDYPVSRTVSLHRKYPKYGQFSAYASRIIGGFFEISNKKDFSKKEVIHTINESPEHAISEVSLSKPVACQYIRYMAPDNSWINLSELQFFYEGKRLHGTPFASNPNRTHNELAAICDNNIDTYYAAEAHNAFIGLDFGKQVYIDKIMYAPRTDGNDIIPGEEYELFQNKGKEKDETPSIVNNFFYGAKALTRSVAETLSEKKEDFISKASEERERTARINEIEKQIVEMKKELYNKVK